MGYERGSLLTTDQTPWPFENPEVCAILIAITNDDPENDQEVYVYTAKAATLLASLSVSIVALSLLQFWKEKGSKKEEIINSILFFAVKTLQSFDNFAPKV